MSLLRRVAGVDGCPGGWVVATSDRRILFLERFAEVLEQDFDHLAVDMPMGLPELGQKRECDALARKLLGRRASCVFPAPPRQLLNATSYDEVRGHGLSIQAFHLIPKVAEVDRCLTPLLQAQVVETHPELAFLRLAGQPMRFNKKTEEGFAERRCLLDFPIEEWLERFPRRRVGRDDLLDAVALMHSAELQVVGQGVRVPADPPLDARGLRMEIWS